MTGRRPYSDRMASLFGSRDDIQAAVASLVRQVSRRHAAALEAAVRVAVSQVPRRLWGLVSVEVAAPAPTMRPDHSRNEMILTLTSPPPVVTVSRFRDVGPVRYVRRYRAVAALMDDR